MHLETISLSKSILIKMEARKATYIWMMVKLLLMISIASRPTQALYLMMETRTSYANRTNLISIVTTMEPKTRLSLKSLSMELKEGPDMSKTGSLTRMRISLIMRTI